MSPFELPFYLIALLATLASAITDTRSGKIPNWITMPVLGLAPLAHAAVGGVDALVLSLLGLACCALLPVVLFVGNAMGGGDVKLFAALGALLGPYLGIETQFLAYCAVTMLLLSQMAYRGQLLRTLRNSLVAALNLVLPKARRRALDPALLTPVRMGIPIFLATAIRVGAQFA